MDSLFNVSENDDNDGGHPTQQQQQDVDMREADSIPEVSVNDGDDDSAWTDDSASSMPPFEPVQPSTANGNRRARVDEDEDEERDRRHPSQRISNPRQSTTATPDQVEATAPPQPPPPQPAPRPFGFAITIDINGQRVIRPLPAGGPFDGGGQGGFLPNFLDLLTSLSERGESEDPERAKQLVVGLEEVPVGLIRRLEALSEKNIGDGEEGDSTTGAGDCQCAICWDRLLDGEGGFGAEVEATAEPQEDESETRDHYDGDADDPPLVDPTNTTTTTADPHLTSTSDTTQPKIVSLPCAHIFHADCLIPWFSRPRQTTCPTCRFNIDPEKLTQRRRAGFAPPMPMPGAAAGDVPQTGEAPGGGAGGVPLTGAALRLQQIQEALGMGQPPPPPDGTGTGNNENAENATEPPTAPASDDGETEANANQIPNPAPPLPPPPHPHGVLTIGFDIIIGPPPGFAGAPFPFRPMPAANGTGNGTGNANGNVNANANGNANPFADLPMPFNAGTGNATNANPADPHPHGNWFPAGMGMDMGIGAMGGMDFVDGGGEDEEGGIGMDEMEMGAGMEDEDLETDEAAFGQFMARVLGPAPHDEAGHGFGGQGQGQPPGVGMPGMGGGMAGIGMGGMGMGGMGAGMMAGAGRTMGEALASLFAQGAPPPPAHAAQAQPAQGPEQAQDFAGNTNAVRGLLAALLASAMAQAPQDNAPAPAQPQPPNAPAPAAQDQAQPPDAPQAQPNVLGGHRILPLPTNHPLLNLFALNNPLFNNANGATNAPGGAPAANVPGAHGLNLPFNPLATLFGPGPAPAANAAAGNGNATTANAPPDPVQGQPQAQPQAQAQAPGQQQAPGFTRISDWFAPHSYGQAHQPEKKAWTLPPAPGPTLRQRIERREREAGLRCYDVSCGLGPSDEDPFATLTDATRRQLSIRAPRSRVGKEAEAEELDEDEKGGELGKNVCPHTFHPACLVSASRLALMGEDATVADGEVEVACSVCRGVGNVAEGDWDEGVQALA